MVFNGDLANFLLELPQFHLISGQFSLNPTPLILFLRQNSVQISLIIHTLQSTSSIKIVIIGILIGNIRFQSSKDAILIFSDWRIISISISFVIGSISGAGVIAGYWHIVFGGYLIWIEGICTFSLVVLLDGVAAGIEWPCIFLNNFNLLLENTWQFIGDFALIYIFDIWSQIGFNYFRSAYFDVIRVKDASCIYFAICKFFRGSVEIHHHNQFWFLRLEFFGLGVVDKGGVVWHLLIFDGNLVQSTFDFVWAFGLDMFATSFPANSDGAVKRKFTDEFDDLEGEFIFVLFVWGV